MSGPIPVPRCQAHKPFFFFGIHPPKNKLERFPLLAMLIFLLTKAYKKGGEFTPKKFYEMSVCCIHSIFWIGCEGWLWQTL